MTDPIEEICRSPHAALRTIRSLRERLRQAQERLPFGGRTLRKIREHTNCNTNIAGYCTCPDEDTFEPGTENLVCSDVKGSEDTSATWPHRPMHKPVIDIDMPCHLVRSSPGRFHLYIDHEVEDTAYWNLLEAMAKAGIVEPGYVSASRQRGYSAVRHPNKLKPLPTTEPEPF